MSKSMIHAALLIGLLSSQSFDMWNISLPFPLGNMGCAIYNNSLITVNGNTNPTYTPYEQSFLLTDLSSTWKQILIPEIQHSDTTYAEVSYFGQISVPIDNLMYVINPDYWDGNYDDNIMLIYNFETHRYLDLTSYSHKLPQYTYIPCVVTNNHLIYSIGGSYGSFLPATAFTMIYNISSDYWSYGSPINVNRSGAGCSFDATQKHIFLFGGVGSHPVYYNSIERYDMNNKKWSVINTTLSYAAATIKCILYPADENIYCFGSIRKSESGTTFLNYVQIFNPSNYSMNANNFSVNIGAIGMGLVIYNYNCLLMVGGFNNELGYFWWIETMNCNWTHVKV